MLLRLFLWTLLVLPDVIAQFGLFFLGTGGGTLRSLPPLMWRAPALLGLAVIITLIIMITLNLFVQIKTTKQLLQLWARIAATGGPSSLKLGQIGVLRGWAPAFFGRAHIRFVKNLGQILLVSLGQVSELRRVRVLRVISAQDELFTPSALLDLVQ